MNENELAKEIVDAAYKIHLALGPGLLESVYERVLFQELNKKGLQCLRQVGMNIQYEGQIFEEAFRADLIVEQKVIIEVKSVEILLPLHYKQLRSYLKLSGLKLGLLINFNTELIKDGIKRIVNNLVDSPFLR